MNYNTIHACERGRVLFTWPYENATCCPKCNKPRYKDKAIIFHLKKEYGVHFKNMSIDGIVRHPRNSKAW